MRTALIVSLLCALPTMANAVCGDRAELMSKLADKYKEAPVAQAVTNDGKLVEVVASKHGGTWTILMTKPDGGSCAMAVGQNWRKVEKFAQATPEPEGLY